MIKISSLLVSLFFAGQVFAGQSGSGGDMITCRSSTSNPLNGVYILDYVAAYDNQTVFVDPRGNVSEKIWKNLYEKSLDKKLTSEGKKILADMALSFLNFYQSAEKQIFQKIDYKNYFIWMPQPFGIIDVSDEHLVQIIPDNCKTTKGNEEIINLKQAVVRESHEHGAIFRYDPAVLTTLRNSSPLQISFLLVHEWLREDLEDTRVLRDVTKLLHTQEFNDASAQEMLLMLRQVSGKKAIVPKAYDLSNGPTIVIEKDVKDNKKQVFTVDYGKSLYVNVQNFFSERTCFVRRIGSSYAESGVNCSTPTGSEAKIGIDQELVVKTSEIINGELQEKEYVILQVQGTAPIFKL